jgi:hypothetical protein
MMWLIHHNHPLAVGIAGIAAAACGAQVTLTDSALQLPNLKVLPPRLWAQQPQTVP